MTALDDTVLRVMPPPLSAEVRRHPLAHRSGLTALSQYLVASEAWRRCTKRQRDVLRALRPAIRQAVLATPVDGVLQLPTIPDAINRQTTDALHRRGLVADGRLTVLGGLVVFWAAKEPA